MVYPPRKAEAAAPQKNVPRPTAICPERHRGRFWRRFDSYEFARYLRAVPVVLAELEPAASAFPLLFQKDQKSGSYQIVALLSLKTCEPTPFVGEKGKWRGTYVPSAIRAYPFSALPTDRDGEFGLMIDEASGLITDDPRDEPFFDHEGRPSEALRQVIHFFKGRVASEIEARAACAALARFDLLCPFRPMLRMNAEDANDLYTISQSALDALNSAVLGDLWHCSALRLAYAQRVSLFHCDWINRFAEAKQKQIVKENVMPSKEKDSLSVFLDALADARVYD